MTVFFLSQASTNGWGPRTVTFFEVVLRVVLTVCRPERLLERCLRGRARHERGGIVSPGWPETSEMAKGRRYAPGIGHIGA